MPSSKPSLDELRAVAQPPELIGRRSAEHWAGRLYMRQASLRVTRHLTATSIAPDQLTLLMIGVGLAGAAVAAVPGMWSAVVALLAIQLYLLLDCTDGELARWRRITSATGAFLDRVGHYVVEAGLIASVGVRADGGYGDVAGWTSVALLAAVLHLLAKAETDLVIVARTGEGLPRVSSGSVRHGGSGAKAGLLHRLRRAVSYFPFHRLLGAIELSLALGLVVAVDELTDAALLPWFVFVLAVIAAVVAIGHAVMIVVSGRLR